MGNGEGQICIEQFSFFWELAEKKHIKNLNSMVFRQVVQKEHVSMLIVETGVKIYSLCSVKSPKIKFISLTTRRKNGQR